MPPAWLPFRGVAVALAVTAAATGAALLHPSTPAAMAAYRPIGDENAFLSAPPSGDPIAPAVASNPRDRLVVEGGGLDLAVGFYGDCTRASEVGRDGAYVDGCIPRPLAYFIGHNPGPFTPMAAVPVGQVVDYYDGSGGLHRLQIVADRQWNRFWGAPPLVQAGVVAQFQTCITLDAVWDRILDAVEIPNPPPPSPVVPRLGDLRSAGA